MKVFALSMVLLLLMGFSCDKESIHVRKRVAVEISGVNMPKTAGVDQEIVIELHAIGSNGCYGTFYFDLTPYPNHLLFTASALFETYGVCTYQITGKDTTVTFRPTMAGMYIFQSNLEPQRIRRDTLLVN